MTDELLENELLEKRIKQNIWQKVCRAIRAGKIEKKANCQTCGEKSKIAHHENYDKPLDVLWLCVRCHNALHGITRRPRKSKITYYKHLRKIDPELITSNYVETQEMS